MPDTAVAKPLETVTPGGGNADRGRRAVLIEVTILALLATVVRVANFDHTIFVDELNHMFAAQSFLHGRGLTVVPGYPYHRAAGFTLLVALSQWLFGNTLAAARVPALVFGIALVITVTLWVRSFAGRAAGLLAGALIALDPDSVYLSQFVRFYSLHALLFTVAAILALSALVGRRGRTLRAVGSIVLLAAAAHLQLNTVIGAFGIVCGLFVVDRISDSPTRWSRRSVVLALLLFLAACVLLIWTGLARKALGLFTHTDPWGEWSRYHYLFYHGYLVDRFPIFWGLFPLLVIAACARYPRETLYLVTIFLAAVVVHSFAAWKAERYIYYAMPAFFVVTALGTVEVLRWLNGRIDEVASRLGMRTNRMLRWAGIGAVLAFAILVQPAFAYTRRMATVSDREWRSGDPEFRGFPDWAVVARALHRDAASADVLVSSDALKALYYFGRVDVFIGVDKLQTQTDGQEFAPSSKLGTPVIAGPESIEALLACYRTGLVIIEDLHWTSSWGVTRKTAAVIEREMTPVTRPGVWGLHVFEWSHATASVEHCPLSDEVRRRIADAPAARRHRGAS